MAALLELRGIGRDYPSGEGVLTVLDGVDLDIHAGEMLAIVGPSGSGKSTLMNLLGCLDRPTRGTYRVNGVDTAGLDADALAALRRERFGFIFQRYHLLGDLDARGNVEVPAVYAGQPTGERHRRAEALLARLGLSDRTDHRPGQLSGGQQQRVSIARALMNGGSVILADEPTGALDTHSGAELIALLRELNAQGHTIVIITHDHDVAANAPRIVEIRDGRIHADNVRADNVRADNTRADSRSQAAPAAEEPSGARLLPPPKVGVAIATRDRLAEAFRMALLAMAAHRMRTFLTMLGIIIGIASVVSVVALATGTRERILEEISALGTNTVEVYPGADFGDSRSGKVRTLRPDDADAIAALPYVDSVTPGVSTSVVIRHGNASATAQVSGVGAEHFRVKGTELLAGRSFDATAVRRMDQVVVIDDNTRDRFFGADGNAIGEIVLLGAMPARVIGVAESSGLGGGGGNLSVWVPYTTAMGRMLGRDYLGSITVRVADDAPMASAEAALTRLLERRHGARDFFTRNTEEIRSTISQTTALMTVLISSIALISLLVGGIGVMNIMLVSVTERTAEIGVRMAVGARQSDILQQFLIEAVMVCLVGGALGIALALSVAALFNAADVGFSMQVSSTSIALAVLCSTTVGIVFGFLPARNAARLDPVMALARE